MQKQHNMSVVCIVFDSMYFLLYLISATMHMVEHRHREKCWDAHGYEGHSNYTIYAVLSGITCIVCIMGVFVHSKVVCFLGPFQRDENYYKRVYYLICVQIFWMGASILMERF